MANKDRNTAAWKRLRAQVVRDEPVCHWCRKAPSTEADHLIELHRGGDNSRDNLVGSCKPCNAKRGARYGNQVRAQKAQARQKAAGQAQTARQVPSDRGKAKRPSQGHTGPSEAVFGSDGQHPEPPQAVSPRGKASRGRSKPTGTYRDMAGRIEPRLVTPVVGATASHGSEVVRAAEVYLDVQLMDWQATVFDQMLAVDTAGDFVFREALVSTGRQNGKSVALQALAAWWLTTEATRRGAPQFVLLISNKLERTMPMFKRLAQVLETRAGAKVRWANGSAAITMPDGSELKVAAAKDNVHGFSIDLCLVDELWDVAPSVIFDALRPSMIARRNPMLAMWSTAGDQSSTAMLRLREQAIAQIDKGEPGRLYFAEWSPPAGSDHEDRRTWTWANPALGTTITWDALEAAADGVDRASFMRAHLNTWISAAQSWLPVGAWEAQHLPDPMPDGGILAIDTSVDESRYVGVRAVSGPVGVVVHCEFIVDSEAKLWAEVERVMADTAVQLRLTPGLEVHCPLPLRRRMEIRGYRELLTGTTIARNMICEGRVWHTGQSILAEHMNRAVAVKSQNSVALSSQRSPGPIELARCAVWAVCDASRPKAAGKPVFATNR